MTEQQLAIMRAGREAQLAALRKRNAEEGAAFREFLRNESRLFEMRAIAARECGRDSQQFKAIDDEWHRALRSAKLPRGSALAEVTS